MPTPFSDPVHFTRLKNMAVSPAHYRARLEKDIERPAYELGRAVHSLVLGGKEVTYYESRRYGKNWERFRAANEDKEILTEGDYDRACRAAEAVLKSPLAAPLLVGRREVEVDWKYLGRACSSRIDVLGANFVTELKTAASAAPWMIRRAALRLHYHAQVAWYQDAAEFIGHPASDGYVIAVETSAPFAVTVMRLTPRTLDEGQRLCRLWMERLLACEAADAWPGYSESVIELDVPDRDLDVELVVDGDEIAA